MAKVRRVGPSLRDVKKRIQALPKTLATDVADAVAPTLTKFARDAYESGQTVYGDPRPPGVQGDSLTLVETGRVLRRLKFTAIGALVQVLLGTRYAKYLIGKYRILPVGDRAAIPAKWRRAIDKITEEEVAARVERGRAA